MRLTDIASAADVSAPTALRILETLIDEGFARRDDFNSKLYMLGDQALLLGLAIQSRNHIRDSAKPALMRLADVSGDTVLLSTRHGIESVCIDREFGSYPIRTNHLEVGSRRPLGVGSVGLALLAWLPHDECETAIGLVKPALAARYPRLTAQRMREEVKRSRDNGYAVMLDAVVDRVGGVAVPIFGVDGRPFAALGVAALSDRITSRLPVLAKALQNEAVALSEREQRRGMV